MSQIEKREATTALSITDEQTEFNHDQVAVLNQLGVSGAGRSDLAVFFHQVKRTGLDPFARQIYMINRKGKQTIQTGIDGFRLIARRSTDQLGGAFGYEDTLWCGPDGVWHDVWLSNNPPQAAKVTVIRDGQRFPAIALLSEYVGLRFNKQTKQQEPNSMWQSKPALMLAKCAEALALRKAFPQDLSGLYTSDEMQQADNAPQVNAAPQPAPHPKAPNPPSEDEWTGRLLELEGAGEMDKIQANKKWAESKGFDVLAGLADSVIARMERNAPSPEDVVDAAQEVLDAEVVPEEDRMAA